MITAVCYSVIVFGVIVSVRSSKFATAEARK